MQLKRDIKLLLQELKVLNLEGFKFQPQFVNDELALTV